MSGRDRSHHKSRGGRGGWSGRNKKQDVPKLAPVELIASPITAEFMRMSLELDAHHTKHENLYKKSRDATIDSKKIIFMLHRIKNEENRESTLAEAKGLLENLQKGVLKEIAYELQKQDPFQYLRAYSFGLQEYVEALSFYHYINNKQLISYEAVQDTLVFDVEAQSPGQPAVAESDDVSAGQPMVEQQRIRIPLTHEDYVMGLADLTGELMRRCINSVGSGDTSIASELCLFLRDIYNLFLLIGGSGPKDLKRKIYTLRQSLEKVENACYTLQVRGSEMPTHMLADVFSSPGRHEGNEDDEGVAFV